MAMIPWWIHYPNVNNEIINLDWILQVSNENTDKIENFIGINTIKYADPILWDITSQYEANTIVVDPQTGDAYISTKAVPYGVALSNDGYWTRIYNYASELHVLREQIAADEQLSTTATAPRSVDDLVFLNGLLYIVTNPMIAGDSYVEGSNCAKTTINAQLLRLHQSDTALGLRIDDEVQDRTAADTDLGHRIDDEIQAREDADTALGGRIDDEIQAREDADTALGGRIDDEAEARADADTALGERIDNLDLNSVYNQSTPGSGLTTNIGLKEGTYNITENTTINAQLVVPKGAILNISEGVTLTIVGQILAGRYQIFTGNGNVIVASRFQTEGYPEWFGAVANNSTDSTTAIQKCINTFNTTLLSNGTYVVSSTIKVSTAHKTVKGVGIWRGGTIIKSTSNSGTILQVGPDTQPSEINNFLEDIRLENFEVARGNSNWTSGSVGVLCQWILRSNLIDVMSEESSLPFLIKSCVYTRFIRCTAFATTLNTGDTSRYYAGFRLTADSTIGSAGSNASIYLEMCSSTTGGTIYGNSWGVQMYGTYGIADVYIDKLETNGVSYGIEAQGNNGRVSAHDVFITNCVIDAVKICGIKVTNVAYGTVTISNNYVALTRGAGIQYGYFVSNGVNVTLNNNQVIGSVSNVEVYGIYLSQCICCSTKCNMIYECELSHYVDGCHSCSLEDNIYNDTTTNTYTIRIASGDGIRINCNAKCKGSYIVALASGVTGCEINATGLNRSDISAGIIAIAGSMPTANGYFNNNYITGYFVKPT